MALTGRFGYQSTSGYVNVACLSSDQVGDLVCVRGNKTVTGRWRVQKADPFVRALMPAIGVLIAKTTPTTGVMQRVGEVIGIFTGLDYSKKYFVGDSGLTSILPTPLPGSVAYIQSLGVVLSEETLLLTGEVGTMIVRRG